MTNIFQEILFSVYKRNKEILLNPEEIIRQLFLIKLTKHYPRIRLLELV